MKIGIDARVLDRAMTGTGRFLFNLINEIPKLDEVNEYYVFSCSELSIDKNFYKSIVHRKSSFPEKIYSPIWINYTLPKLLRENDIDVLFSPNILVPLRGINEIKLISVVHDVFPKAYKEYYPFFYRVYLDFLLPLSLKRSQRIITVSEFSKAEIIKYFKIPGKEIRVIYNTASSIFKPQKHVFEENDKFRKKFNLPDKFILNVGVVNKRKNIIALLKMYDVLLTQGSRLGLVLVGKPGFDYENIAPEIEKRRKGVVRINSMSDDELLQLYNMAFVFVFPSYYEGFGIPPLEAMQTGLPVIASNTSSLPEVVGEGGITRDPDDYVSFANDIIKFETDSEFHSLMRAKALQQSKKFNVRETTQQLIDIFNEFKLTK